jgi:hypothetical protein
VSGTKRGRETALDMVRTLLVVFALVVPMWFFGRSSPGDAKRIRPVDPREAYSSFVADTHGPVLATAPSGWTCTVRAYEVGGVLRVGYVHDNDYVEFSGARGTAFLPDATGHASRVGAVDVDGVTWQDYRDHDGHQSLVRTSNGVTVLVGGVRETATEDELEAFARLVR